jgi:hypothetical protein
MWFAEESDRRVPEPERPPGLLFEVTTDTPGLRVHYHPSYWHETKTAFGNLSTPSYDYILPGRYMFGAVGREQDLTFDLSEYDIPPSRTAHLFR